MSVPVASSAPVSPEIRPSLGTVQVLETDGKLEARFGAAWSAVETFDASANHLRVEPCGSGQVVSVSMENGHAAALRIGPDTFTRIQ